jgi:nucleoside-specific outer membrane channel protein Tsx
MMSTVRGLKTVAIVALGVGLVGGPVGAARASEWSDTYVGYRYGTEYREPFNSQKITKNIVSLTHASGYAYGSNFFNVDMLSSDHKDPASGGGGGAHELYTAYRTTFSLGKISGTPMKFGPIRDVGITGGFDYNAKDDQFSARVLKKLIGPTLSFDVPGFFDLSLLYYKEHNHNWFATGPGFGTAGCVAGATTVCEPDVNFKATWQLSGAWGIPFNAGVPAAFKGFLAYTGKKGTDGVGAQTKPETLIELAVMFDVGSAPESLPNLFFQYW